MRKAVIRKTDGLVVNIIEWKPSSKWQPPEGCHLIAAGKGSPGDTWDGKKFVKPVLPEPEPVRDRLAELEARVKALEDAQI